ncbi:unnamed protein product [Parnassius mnemosyne]|uniref:Reverse transcriptase domain-containing protein n=1 Tax=Parnassius mnemosyne TaxID=213953 RepID=A0AAV1LH79_9NEOP
MQGVSIVLMQEPYVGAKAHVTLGSNYRVVQKVSHDKNKPVRSAIVVLNPNIQYTVNPDLITEDIVTITIKVDYKKIGIISIYLHEKGNIDEDLAKINQLTRVVDTSDYIIAGDVNAKSVWWGCDADDKRGTHIMETIAELNLEIVNTGRNPTFAAYRMGKLCSSIIDVTACSVSLINKIKNWRVDEIFSTLSNHKPILYELVLENSIPEKTIISTRKFDTRKANWEAFKQELTIELSGKQVNKEIIEQIKTTQDMDIMIDKYTQCISSACFKVIPTIKSKKTKKAAIWWTKELKLKKEEMVRTRRRIRNAHPKRRKLVIELYLKARDEYIHSIETAATQSWKDLCSTEEKENVWQRTYRILKVCSNTEEEKLLRNKDGTILSERESANLLAETFFPWDSVDTDTEEQVNLRNSVQELTRKLENNTLKTVQPFTTAEIEHVFHNMNPKKAPGGDSLTSDICQAAYENDPEIALSLINQCLKLGYFPTKWKIATIKIIPKPNKEDYSIPKSYRPIGLLPILGKLLEKLFVNRLQWQLGHDNKMNNRQYGFTPQRSTEDALYDTTTAIKTGLRKKEIVALVSLDIEGAFDNAWWPAIIYQLQAKQAETSILRLVTSYLSNRVIDLGYAGEIVTRPTNKGCIQGSTCGPILWNILLDSLLQATQDLSTHVQAFADDILLIGTNNNGEQLEKDLNHTLKLISDWGKEYKLKFAPHKTQAIIITKKLKFHTPKLYMEGIELTYTEHLTILGLTIDKNFNFKPHLDNISRKAVNLYKMVSKAARAQWGLNSDIVRTIYTAVVEPTVLYATFQHKNLQRP